jgi:hypothetical protein
VNVSWRPPDFQAASRLPPAITHEGVSAKYRPAFTTSALLTFQLAPIRGTDG